MSNYKKIQFNSIQFNSIHLFSIIKKQQNTLKVRTCTQQDGGGTTKSKSLKMLYPLQTNSSIQT